MKLQVAQEWWEEEERLAALGWRTESRFGLNSLFSLFLSYESVAYKSEREWEGLQPSWYRGAAFKVNKFTDSRFLSLPILFSPLSTSFFSPSELEDPPRVRFFPVPDSPLRPGPPRISRCISTLNSTYPDSLLSFFISERVRGRGRNLVSVSKRQLTGFNNILYQ